MSDGSLIGNALDRRFVLGHLEAVRRHLDGLVRADTSEKRADTDLSPDEASSALGVIKRVQEAYTALRRPLLMHPAPARQSRLEERAFVSRDPLVSIMQTVLEDRLEHKFGDRIEAVAPAVGSAAGATRVARVPDAPPDHEHFWDRFTRLDPRWEIEIAEALVKRFFRHKHAFNSNPSSPVTMGATARLVLLGDWGTGLQRAQDVAAHAREWLLDAQRDGRDVHAIHLGDVYYSGEASEYEKRMLAPKMWPVAPDEATAIGSWCLTGNHDMYGGAWGYFERLLGDERFSRQRSPDGKASSYFDLVNDDWRVIGLDTSWQDDLFKHPGWGSLEDPQAEHVISAASAEDGRKLLLLSHHQLVSAYDDGLAPTIREKLKPALDSGRVRGWLWGHEHRCMTFGPQYGVPFCSCIGHGGVPELAHPESAPVPSPGLWEYRGQFESDGEHWTRFGFAVLDFNGPSVRVTYVDELGNTASPPGGPVEVA
jgi:hypothetical protein